MIQRTSEEAFQALWIDIQFFGRPNIICGIIYKKHNSPQDIQDYFDEALERIGPSNKSIFIMGHVSQHKPTGVEKCNYALNILLSLQAFTFYSDNW